MTAGDIYQDKKTTDSFYHSFISLTLCDSLLETFWTLTLFTIPLSQHFIHSTLSLLLSFLCPEIRGTMRLHAILSLLAAYALAAPLIQQRDNLDSLDGPKDHDKGFKQMGKAYENAMKEYGKQTGKSGQDLAKAYQEYAKTAGQLATDACKFSFSKYGYGR